MKILYYLSLIINILCILMFVIFKYLEYKSITRIKYGKLMLFLFIISAIMITILRNMI